MAAPNANEQDKYPELTNSIVSRMLMSDPKLALEPEKVFEQARKVSDVLGPQGFTGIDRITNLPGGVTVYQQGNRTSQLTFDDAKKVVESSLQQNNANAAQPGNVSAVNPPSVPQSSDVATSQQSANAQVPAPATPTSNPMPAATSNPAAQVEPLNIGGFNFNPQDLNYKLGDITLGGRLNDPNTPNLFANYTNPNQSAFLQSGEAGVNGKIDSAAVTDIYGKANFRFDENTRVNIGANYNLPSNDLSATIGGNYISPDRSTQINGQVAASTQNGLSGNINVIAPVNGNEGRVVGDVRVGPGADTIGATYTSTDQSTIIGGRVNNTAQGVEVLGNVTVPVNGNEGRVVGDVRVGPGADTASLTYTRTTDQFNSLSVGGNYNSGTLDTPGSASAFVDYKAGDQRVNYGARAQLGAENTVSGFVNYQNPANTLSASVLGQYSFDTNVGQASGRVSYTPDSNTSVFAGFSAKTNGETAATVGIALRFGGGQGSASQDPDTQRLLGLQNAAEQGRQLDSSVADFRISQLTGKDRQLYDQALTGVNRLNEGGANLPARETALSLAALADSQNPPLSRIGDVRLGPAGADGSQKLYVGSGGLDNPATRSASIERNEAANTPAEQSLAKLSENNLIQSLQNRGNQQQGLETLEQNQPSRAIAGR